MALMELRKCAMDTRLLSVAYTTNSLMMARLFKEDDKRTEKKAYHPSSQVQYHLHIIYVQRGHSCVKGSQKPV